MREYLELGPVPCEEECAQVGTDNYHEKARKECAAYKNQLNRLFPDGNFTIKPFFHEFGSYFEVCIFYDDNDETSLDYAYNVESNIPSNWDEEAKKELGIN